jgi:tetratricopeptide (TPR) repeat protein
MKLNLPRWKRWLLGSLLAVVVLGGGYYVARHLAWPAFKDWRIARMNRAGAAFLAAGDPANALLTARKSLQSSTRNPAAWRLAVAASLARSRPEAVWYQDNLVREEPTRANQLELMRLALRFEVPGYALGAIKALATEARSDPEFHRLAARIYARTGQPAEARAHLTELTRVAPDDHAAQLDLAEIELAADPARQDAALRARVLALADDPDLRGRALTLLLRDNLAGKVTTGTAELVRRLQLTPDLGVPGRLLGIEGLFLLGRPEAATLLAQLQAEVAAQPADVARVLDFLTRTGRLEQVQPWVATLPEATRRNEDVQRMVAEALLARRDAAGLEAYLRGGHWPNRDYLRAALLAHAYRDLGRSAEFAAAWKLALVSGGSDLRKATALLARADEWKWVSERHEVVWKLFALVPTNESVQRILILWERHQGNTTNLNRLFTRIVEIQPGDEVARNNLAYTSLLLGTNLPRASRLAAELTAASPQNPFYATTHALALYKQGKVAEALARLDALSAVEQAEPVRRLLRALCLAALGQAGPAADQMNGVVLREMLPEEKRLAESGRTEIARLDRVQGNRSRLQASRAGLEQNPGTAGWLALVAPATRAAATTDMQLADSLYATPDWTGLQELLRSANWQAADYLRWALRSRVARQLGDGRQSSESWRQALALADRDPTRLQDLRALATRWQWTPERIETLNRLFERTPGDRVLLAELREHYRTARRTAELQRVLGLFLAGNTDATDEAVALAYYSLLLDTNLARAHVVARHAFEAAPADTGRRMVYVFSLWKQRRAAEARPLLNEVASAAVSDLVPVPLLRATIQVQLGDTVAARASLGQFNAAAALPEETALATRLAGQLATQAGSSVSSDP